VFRELGIEKAVLIGLSMGGSSPRSSPSSYGHLLKALVLADTTAHGIGPDATDDAFLAVADKQGYKKAVQDLSDIIQFRGLAGASRLGATRSRSYPGIRRPGSGSLAQ